jgi:antitoxin (DNA-binding transcriptional repressor) of toxin-antitoxin stability system
MEEIAASKFKVNCLAVVERVRKTRKPVVITRYGKAVAELRPSAEQKRRKSWLGGMAGTGEILGDIVAPAFDLDEWDMLRDEPSPRHAYSDLGPAKSKAAVKPRRKGARRSAKSTVGLAR